ncbi:MAG: PepSY domain-containing protein [Candidatus Acidiferrales bacterium]
MSWSRFIFKSHKWLAVAVGLLTLVWFVSGIVMVMPGRFFSPPAPPDPSGPAGPGYRDVAVTAPQAVAVAEAAVGGEVEVSGVSFLRVAGRLLYQVKTAAAGSHLVDAVTGERFVIDEQIAREMVRRSVPGAKQGDVTVLQAYDLDYAIGPLPAFCVALDDGRDTKYYVAVENGEMRATNRAMRWRDRFVGLHTFRFLRHVMDGEGVRITLILTSIVGTAMSVFGMAILWVQFVNWRARRKEA